MKRQTLILGIVLGLLALGLAGPAARPGLADFDGDGYADLVIGAPSDRIADATWAGSVSVIYGTGAGLYGSGAEIWHQNYLDGSNAEPRDWFGVALAVGDFDGDGYFDLAVGVPLEDVDRVTDAGAVNVIYSAGRDGLDVAGNQYWNQNEPGMGDVAQPEDYFGNALAAGDFNGDGYDDLAVGIPGEDIGSEESGFTVDAGAMMVLYGSAEGLTAAGTVWSQAEGVEADDRYGLSLAAGDFDNDGYDDLAVGIPLEDVGSVTDAGAVQIYYGSHSGLRRRIDKGIFGDFWHQDRSGIADTADEGDRFGQVLTVGDFDGDGYDDLAIGVPWEDVGSITWCGAVNVLYGSKDGITGSGSDYWHQDVGTVGSLCEKHDRFGYALAAADFDGDGYDDLAVGVPYEGWNDPDTGIVQILYGSAGGLTDAGNQLWRQGLSGILGTEEAGQHYGYALAAGDFDGNGYADLAIGIPDETINTIRTAGAVNVLYGAESGLTATGNQFWYQGSSGLPGTAEDGDRFGSVLAALPRTRSRRTYLPLVLRHP
ncbi:MAG: hypothetical protein D6775_09035 [Caldilineae bacterium]|nr:MAG: hypothetical protein D6775_09035 [Caldilineae bacterium]